MTFVLQINIIFVYDRVHAYYFNRDIFRFYEKKIMNISSSTGLFFISGATRIHILTLQADS